MDAADIANDLVIERIEALLAARKPVGEVKSRAECEECGAAIPAARRKALDGRDCCLCVHCQSRKENGL